MRVERTRRRWAIRPPPLRERPEDIPHLVDHVLRRLRLRTGKAIEAVSPAAMARLRAHDFPGSVRDLQNILERAFVLCRGEVIDAEHLPPEILPGRAPARRLNPSEERIVTRSRPGPERSLPEEARALLSALESHQWSRTRTARALGIGRNTVWRRIGEYGLG